MKTFQRLRQCFKTVFDPFSLASTLSDYGNTIIYKPEVETVPPNPQTGNTDYLATETDTGIGTRVRRVTGGKIRRVYP